MNERPLSCLEILLCLGFVASALLTLLGLEAMIPIAVVSGLIGALLCNVLIQQLRKENP